MGKLYNLTYPQKSILLTENFYKNTSINNICGNFLVNMVLDFEVFKKAINMVIMKNDSFRIHLTNKHEEIKQYITDFKEKDFEVINIKSESEVEVIEKRMMKRNFSIMDNDLYEIKLFRLENGYGGLIMNAHHLISDAWTLHIFPQKVMYEYNLLCENLVYDDTTSSSYIDYIKIEKEYLESSKFKKDEEYWKNLYKKIPTPVSLPSDLPETDTNSDLSSLGERVTLSISKSKMKLINEYCLQHRITVFNFLIAIYSIYISKITSQNNFSLGTPIFNRTNYKEKNITGMFVNIVPFNININSEILFTDFALNIGKDTMSLLRHQRFPYELFLEELRKDDPLLPNLYNIVLSYQLNKQAVNVEHNYNTKWAFNGHTSDELSIHFFDFDEENYLNVAYDYKKLKYSKNYIKNIHITILNIINQILNNENITINDIDVITNQEKNRILNGFNSTYLRYNKALNVIKEFQKNVNLTPDKKAIIFENESLTYKELDDKSNMLANYLTKNKIKKGDVVGVSTSRSLELAISLIAILKTGAIYLPIDPEYPKDRIEYMLEDSGAKIILTNRTNNKIESAIEKINVKEINVLNSEIYKKNKGKLDVEIDPEDLIYIIYTSGSTGKPKGVMLKHKNIINFLKGTKNVIDFNKNKVMVSITTICFDIFGLEFWGTLTSGMTLVIANEDEQNSAELLNKLCIKNNVNMIQTTPSRYKALISNKNELEFLKNMKDILVGGESLPKILAKDLLDLTKANIYNMYGPTETAIWSTIKQIKNENNINIGKPIANTKCYILDKDRNLLPTYIPGELYIGGDGVAKGYLNRKELTDEKFVESPFENESLIYNTNDLAYYNDLGEIIHLGRTDFQVKIRGYRVELEEIESKIHQNNLIKDVIVTADEEQRYLICYYIADDDINVEKENAELLKVLPNYMIPSVYCRLEKFPLTPNGKLDRKRLPKVEKIKTKDEKSKTKTEKILSSVIAKVVNNNDIGINSPFATIGLDSLGIIEVQTGLLQYNYVLNTQDFYKYNTIKTLAEHIDNNIYTYKEEDAQIPAEFRHKDGEILAKINDKTFSDQFLGDVFLTGANGFIGIHVLHELLKTTSSKVYCLVRRGKDSSEERLINKYKFYFKEDISNLLNKRVYVFDGNIEKENIGLTKKNIKEIKNRVDTVIHTAASVKHYGDYSEFEKINVEGTKNVCEFALKYNLRLIHVSSISVSGNYLVKQDNRNIDFSENNLYIGQNYSDNVYVHSKFEAEKNVFNYMKKGLVAQIHRIGILSGRLEDGVFQENINDNAFYNRIKSMITLSVFSEKMLNQKIEFTPVDVCCQDIVLLAKNHIADDRVFHLYNHNFVEIKDVIEVLKSFGKEIEIVSDSKFREKLVEASKSDKAKMLYGIINDLNGQNGNAETINYSFSVNIKSDYTQKYLHLLKNDWNKIDNSYLKKIIQYMIDVYFI